MLSQHSRYALKALLHLASCNRVGPQPIVSIAAEANVPRKFLEAIFVDLKRNGFVNSTRGPRGGYVLTRPPAEITFGQVIRSIEGPLALIGCASQKFYRPCRDCPDEGACALRRVMMEAREQLVSVLDNRTLADATSDDFCVVPELAPAE
ncbi:Rrf2 family transcriptional regulator [Sphingomonas sp. BIUV-7]|uniref:Rrf2 family transcriptional regulator n=1 Tax=Sphingomonas natans TaxID=3063330 RepID=A0ABT8YEK8_9SPHN|nr:Rrf2 family transcriptional regulator [Sphingomonas sp. BIUV-7]MDO6416382.1 Rrf2 family transcriptional regulator [Sphingomonas sp. BIUV-7]